MPYPDGSTAPDAAPTRADRAAEAANTKAECVRTSLIAQARGIAEHAAQEWCVAVRRIAPDLWPQKVKYTLAELIDDTLIDYLISLPDLDTAADQARLDAQWAHDEREDD